MITNGCTEFVIEPTDDHPRFRFMGSLVAKVSSERKNSRCWTELEAYKTRAGKWVIVTLGCVDESLTDYEKRISVLIFDEEARMTAKLGYGRLAEQLYRKLGLEEVYVS